MPILVGLAGLWVVVPVVLEVTRDMVLLVGIQVLMMVVWTPITCVARVLELAFHLMVHQDMHLVMAMVLLVMVLVMVVMAIMVVQVLVMVPLPVQLMGIPMLAMQVGLLVPLEVHGALKLHLVMVLWVMGMLLLGVLVLVAVVQVLQLLANHPLELLGTAVKVMDMGDMEVMMDLMGTLVMGLLEVVLVVLQIVMLVQVGEIYKGAVVVTWEVDMVM